MSNFDSKLGENKFDSKLGENKFDSKLGEKKSFELYNYYKSLQSKKESLRVSRQVDDAQCTFAPNLKKDKVSTATPYAKHID